MRPIECNRLKVCDLFSDEECYNYFKTAGYEAD